MAWCFYVTWKVFHSVHAGKGPQRPPLRQATRQHAGGKTTIKVNVTSAAGSTETNSCRNRSVISSRAALFQLNIEPLKCFFIGDRGLSVHCNLMTDWALPLKERPI